MNKKRLFCRWMAAALVTGLVFALFADGFCADAKESEKASEDAVGLSIEGIKLFSGEKGLELWRLNATWGHLSREGDNVDLDAPSVRYAMGDPAAQDYLYVRADKGRITDGQSHLRLWGNVVATRGEDTASGPTLTYDSKTRTMRFPDGVTLGGSSGSVVMKEMSWELGVNRITGEGDVNVLIKPRSRAVLPNEAAPQNNLEQAPALKGQAQE